MNDSPRMEVSASKQMLLATLALFVTWIVFTTLLLVHGQLEVVPVAGWSGSFAGVSLFTFVPLLIGFVSPRMQLRFWWLVVGASEVWGVVLLRLFLGVLLPRLVGDVLFWAVLCFGAAASGIYLLELRWLLRRYSKSYRYSES